MTPPAGDPLERRREDKALLTNIAETDEDPDVRRAAEELLEYEFQTGSHRVA